MTIEKTTRGYFTQQNPAEYRDETAYNNWEKSLSDNYLTRKDEFIAPTVSKNL